MDKQFEIKIDKDELLILRDALRCHLAANSIEPNTKQHDTIKDLTIKIAGSVEDYNYESKNGKI